MWHNREAIEESRVVGLDNTQGRCDTLCCVRFQEQEIRPIRTAI